MFSAVNTVIFFISSYFIIVWLHLEGINGYCLALFWYEFSFFLICLYFFFFELEEEIRDTSLPITHNLCWYTTEVIKTTSGTAYNIITREMLLIILTMGDSGSDIAVYSVLGTINIILAFKGLSVSSLPLNTLNYLLSKTQFVKADLHYYKFLLYIFIQALITGMLIYFLLP